MVAVAQSNRSRHEMQDDVCRDRTCATSRSWTGSTSYFPSTPEGPASLSERKIRFTVRQVLEQAPSGIATDAKDDQETGGEFRPPIATAADEKRVIRRLRRLGYRPDPHRTREDGPTAVWVPIRS